MADDCVILRLTIGSLLEPIFCVCAGVYLTGTQENLSILRLLVGGAFSALGICLMVQLALRSLTSYRLLICFAIQHFTAMQAMRVHLEWIPGLVFLSCLIALVATTTALAVFFRLRALWQSNVWKQLGCAMILSGAVCCMHYTGSLPAFSNALLFPCSDSYERNGRSELLYRPEFPTW